MSLSSAAEAALDGVAPRLAVAVELVLPAHTVRWLDGAGFAVIDGDTFNGRDPDYGVLAEIEALNDGIGSEAPSIRMTVQPASVAAAAALTAPGMQGCVVRVREGVLSTATGQFIGDLDVVFVGEVDVPTLTVDASGRVVALDCVSAWERLFDQDEGVRMTDPAHQAIWPGEKGFEFVPYVQTQMPWGGDAPRPSVVTDVPQSLY